MTLDKIDIQILEILTKDGKSSFTDIAKSLNLSIGTIRNRYNKLVDEGILNIVGWVDPISLNMHAYVRINIQIEDSRQIEQIINQISKIEQVTFIARTSGEYEIEVNVLCKDNNELLDIIDTQIIAIEGVKKTNTTVYLKVHKWASYSLNFS